MMGFLVLGTVLACLYVPSNGSSPGSLRTRRGRGGNRRVRQRLRHRRRAVDGLEDRDRRSYSRRRPERFTERFLFGGGRRVGERISVTLYCLAAVVLSSLALALAAQLLRRHNTGGGNNETTPTSPDRSTE